MECAFLFRSVADELTKALAKGDVARLKDLFPFSVGLANIAAPCVAVGIAVFLPAHQCLVEIRDGGEADSQLIQESEEIRPAAGTIHLSSSGRASLTTTANATVTGTTVETDPVTGTAALDYGGEVTAEGNVIDRADMDDNTAVPSGRTRVTRDGREEPTAADRMVPPERAPLSAFPTDSSDATATSEAHERTLPADPVGITDSLEVDLRSDDGNAPVSPATIEVNAGFDGQDQTIPAGTTETTHEAGPADFTEEDG